MDQYCQNCRHWESLPEADFLIGECRYLPPSPAHFPIYKNKWVRLLLQTETLHVAPKTKRDYRCGMHYGRD